MISTSFIGCNSLAPTLRCNKELTAVCNPGGDCICPKNLYLYDCSQKFLNFYAEPEFCATESATCL